jgi:hypothetical protein
MRTFFKVLITIAMDIIGGFCVGQLVGSLLFDIDDE